MNQLEKINRRNRIRINAHPDVGPGEDSIGLVKIKIGPIELDDDDYCVATIELNSDQCGKALQRYLERLNAKLVESGIPPVEITDLRVVDVEE